MAKKKFHPPQATSKEDMDEALAILTRLAQRLPTNTYCFQTDSLFLHLMHP